MSLKNCKKEDYIREFEYENKRCWQYFDYMYRILQFSFVAFAAIITFGFTAETAVKEILFKLVLPICLYMFGILYTYNAYVLSVCGKREQKLHEGINQDSNDVLNTHLCSDRRLAFISYGVQLGFYLVIPILSIIYGMISTHIMNIYSILSFIAYGIYFIIMSTIIYFIGKDFFIQ